MKRVWALLLIALLFPLMPAEATADLEVAEVYALNGVVTFTASAPISGYCFTKVNIEPASDSPDWMAASGTKVSVFKMDGDYYLWLRDESGSVSLPRALKVTSSYTYAIDAVGLQSLTEPAKNVFASLDEGNSFLYRNVTEAGMYTRNGVLSAAASLLTVFAAAGKTVPYQAGGSYQGEEDWGINPEWGAKLASPVTDANGTYYYTGMQCVASLVWAYKQAGLNLSNSAAGFHLDRVGSATKNGDNRINYTEAKGGDIIVNKAHYLMVFDRLDTDLDGVDDAYLTFEMRAPDLLIMVHTFRSIRYLEVYNMDAVFSDAGRLKDKARFWEGTLHIPEEGWPALLQQANAHSQERLAAKRLMSALGL